jgi:hypothetical protein
MNIDFATWNNAHDEKQIEKAIDEDFVLGEINPDICNEDSDDEDDYKPCLRRKLYSIVRTRYVISGRIHKDGHVEIYRKLDYYGETIATGLTYEQSEMFMLNEYLAAHDIKRRKFSSFSELVETIGESDTLTYDSFSAGAYQYSRG